MTMQQVVRDINEDYQNRIETIKANNPYDDLEMSVPRCMAAGAVHLRSEDRRSDNAMEVATMTEEKSSC